jgi:hypothetical protein
MSDWCNFPWSPWVPFEVFKKEWSALPVDPGLYRIRPANKELLVYVGETGRSLKERLGSLRRGVLSDLMPYNDPHTAAPNLWAWRQEEKWSFECSATIFSGPKTVRKSLECFLLWQYRFEKGESTLCNHGRFHKNYVKSSDRSKGRRGFRLPSPKINNSSGESLPPLQIRGSPADSDWMQLNWSENLPLEIRYSNEIPETSGVYKILATDLKSLVYIGESNRLLSRFTQHCHTFNDKKYQFAFTKLPDQIKKYQLHELENDLIAAYYSQTTNVPIHQFSKEN